jgi:hypothetical protein
MHMTKSFRKRLYPPTPRKELALGLAQELTENVLSHSWVKPNHLMPNGIENFRIQFRE